MSSRFSPPSGIVIVSLLPLRITVTVFAVEIERTTSVLKSRNVLVSVANATYRLP